MEDAVLSRPEGTLIRLHVTPGSSHSGLAGYDQWRNRIKVSVTGRQEEGEANAELVELITKWFGIEKSDVQIVSGKMARRKSVSLRGINRDGTLEVLRSLREER